MKRDLALTTVVPALGVALAFWALLFPMCLESVSMPLPAENVFVQKVVGKTVTILRSNRMAYEIEAGVGCLSLSRYVGKNVLIDSGGLFLGVGSRLILPGADQECRILSSKQIDAARPAAPSRGLAQSVIDEFSLFDSQAKAFAYLDLSDEQTIFLWSGEPLAYLDEDSIYGFNGKHIGWYKDGFVYDGDGKVVLALANAFRNPVSPAPIMFWMRLRLKRL